MKHLIYTSLFILIAGCAQSSSDAITSDDVKAIRATTVDAQEYPTWLTTNGASLTREQVIGDLTYKFTRIPSEMLAVREVGVDASEAQLTEAKSHYSELVYFRLEIVAANHNGELLKKDLTDVQEYNRRVTYAAFGAQKDISMELGTDVIPCALCEFERSFDVAPVATFLLAFDIDEATADLNPVTLIFNDQLFNNGIIRFAWNAAEINAYPSLKGTNS